MNTRFLALLAFVAAIVFVPCALAAQGGMPAAQGLAGQSLRGYTHMFIAYFIAWALVLGWVVSIARRLGRVEKALKK